MTCHTMVIHRSLGDGPPSIDVTLKLTVLT